MFYVEKLVIYLHDNLNPNPIFNPKRVLFQPPFRVKGEGYAGFMVNVEIYFKGLPSYAPAKMVKLDYDLCLIPDATLVINGMEKPFCCRESSKMTPKIVDIPLSYRSFIRIFEEGRKTMGHSSLSFPAPSKGPTVSYTYKCMHE